MRITFSARAWILGLAAGLACTTAITTLADTGSKTGSRQSTVTRSSIIRDSAVKAAADADQDDSARQKPSAPASKNKTVRAPQAPSAVRQVAAGANDVGGGQNSAVQQKLEELYRKDGRSMPAMEMQALPDRDLKQTIPPLPKQGTSSKPASNAVAQNRVQGFFKSLNPFGRRTENDERPKKIEAMPPEAMRQQQQLQQQQLPPNQFQQQLNQPSRNTLNGPSLVPPTPARQGNAPAANPIQLPSPTAPRLLGPETTQGVKSLSPAPSSDLPEFRPAVQLPQDNKKSVLNGLPVDLPAVKPLLPEVPSLQVNLPDTPVGAALEAPKPIQPAPKAGLVDELDGVFSEMSETEADAGKAKPKAAPVIPAPAKPEPKTEVPAEENPFTGLKLDATKAIEKSVESTTEAVKKEALSLPSDLNLPLPGLPEAKLPETSLSPTSNGDSAAPKLLTPDAPQLKSPVLQAEDDDDDDDGDDDEEMEATASSQKSGANAQDKLKLISERRELKGLKGFCPVTLRDQRDLEDALPQFQAEHAGRTYNFASASAKKKFEANPAPYVPVENGVDMVLKKTQKRDQEGSLDHALWFKDRLYLFSSSKTRDEFEANPTKFVTIK